MNSGNSDETVDFKPFFDMVVGLLFLLLILVSAQLFFSQWQVQPSPAELARQEAEARRHAFEAGVDEALTRIAQQLGAAGFSPAVDRLARSISIPAGEVFQKEAPGDPDRAALTRFAPAIFKELRCLSSPPPSEGCPGAQRVRITRLETRLLLPAAEAGATPRTPQRLAGLALSSALFGAEPGLLDITAPSGSPAIETGARVETIPTAGGGQLVLDFAFIAADTPAR